MLKSRAYSIVNNFPIPKIMNNGSIANVEADQPTKFSLLKGQDVVIVRFVHLDEDMSDTKNNMIAYGKRVQKEIREIDKKCPKDGK